jgi:hypothetical protein
MELDQRTYHGEITPEAIASALSAEFNRANLTTKVFRGGKKLTVQISTPRVRSSGGPTAISVQLIPVEDGVQVRLSEQKLIGVAASLGQSALMALLRPTSLLHRLDDIAQDVTSLQLEQQIWEILDQTAEAHGASHEISERLRRLSCAYCQSANPVGEANCVACGAPLGLVQPKACTNCGYVVSAGDSQCPECETILT